MNTISRSIILLSLTALLVACEGQGALAHFSSSNETAVDQTQVESEILGDPVDQGLLQSSAPTGEPPQHMAEIAEILRGDLPADSAAYYTDQAKIKADQAGSANAGYIEPITKIEDGQPVFRAECVFNDVAAECELSTGEVVDEDYLAAHLPLVRNADVLRMDWACGKICVNAEGKVVGRVSPAMLVWRDTNCSWVVYGQPACN